MDDARDNKATPQALPRAAGSARLPFTIIVYDDDQEHRLGPVWLNIPAMPADAPNESHYDWLMHAERHAETEMKRDLRCTLDLDALKKPNNGNQPRRNAPLAG